MEWAADAGEAVARAGAGAGAPLVVHVVPAGGRGAGWAGAHPGRVDALRAAGCVGLRVELGSRAAQQLSAFVPLQGVGERVLMIGLGGRVLVECGPDRVADPDALLQDLERGLQAFEAAQKQEALAAALGVIAAQAAPGASPGGGGGETAGRTAECDAPVVARGGSGGAVTREGARPAQESGGASAGGPSGSGPPGHGGAEDGAPLSEEVHVLLQDEGEEAAAAAGPGGAGTKDVSGEEAEADSPDAEDAVHEGASAPPLQATAPRTSFIQIKLTSGEPLVGEFDAGATLADVYDYIDVHRTDGYTPYKLVVPFPRRVLGEADLGQKLRALDLHPRSALMLVATGPASGEAAAQGPSAAGPAGGLLTRLGSAVSGALQPLAALWGSVSSAGAQPAGEPVPRPMAPRRFGGNVHGLRDDEDGAGDPRAEAGPGGGGPNEYWNGNSTQFSADDKKDD